MGNSKLEEIITGADPVKLKEIYANVTQLMVEHSNTIYEELKQLAERNNGTVVYKDAKHKVPDRAIAKYLKDVVEKKGDADLPDLGDNLRFRGSFNSVEDCIDFSLRVIRENGKLVNRISSFIGSGTPYQGVSMNINHDGL